MCVFVHVHWGHQAWHWVSLSAEPSSLPQNFLKNIFKKLLMGARDVPVAKSIQVRTAASIFTCQVIRLAQDFLKHNCYPSQQPQVIFRPGQYYIENNIRLVCFLFFSSVEGISLERRQGEIMRMYTQIKEITETLYRFFCLILKYFSHFIEEIIR